MNTTTVTSVNGKERAFLYEPSGNLLRFIEEQSEQVKRTVSQVSVGGGENG